MAKWKMFNIHGWWWLYVIINGKAHFVRIVGKVGDCIRP